MYAESVVQSVIAKFPQATAVATPDKFVRDPQHQVMVPPEKLREVCAFLKNDLGFDLPNHMTVVDYIKEDAFELVYYLYSTKNKQGAVVKSRVTRTVAEIDTVSDIWPGMDWQEREVFDLMGINFKGHKYMKKIMMWDGFPGFPLRKDYVHVTDKYDSGLEVGTPGLNEKGVPIPKV